jgi:hypothetical protein
LTTNLSRVTDKLYHIRLTTNLSRVTDKLYQIKAKELENIGSPQKDIDIII